MVRCHETHINSIDITCNILYTIALTSIIAFNIHTLKIPSIAYFVHFLAKPPHLLPHNIKLLYYFPHTNRKGKRLNLALSKSFKVFTIYLLLKGQRQRDRERGIEGFLPLSRKGIEYIPSRVCAHYIMNVGIVTMPIAIVDSRFCCCCCC